MDAVAVVRAPTRMSGDGGGESLLRFVTSTSRFRESAPLDESARRSDAKEKGKNSSGY